jgi:hypothetical protein
VGNRWAEDVIEMTGPRAERFSSHDHHQCTAGSSRCSKHPQNMFPDRRSVKLPAAPLSNFQNVDRPTRAARNPPAMRRWVTVRFGTVPRRLGLNRGEERRKERGVVSAHRGTSPLPSVELCISRPLRNICEYQFPPEQSVQTDINNRSADDLGPGTDARAPRNGPRSQQASRHTPKPSRPDQPVTPIETPCCPQISRCPQKLATPGGHNVYPLTLTPTRLKARTTNMQPYARVFSVPQIAYVVHDVSFPLPASRFPPRPSQGRAGGPGAW